MSTCRLTNTDKYLQDLCAVLYALLHPGIHKVFHCSETGTVIEGGEETHADGAGQSTRRGDPPTSLIKGLYGEEKKLLIPKNYKSNVTRFILILNESIN